MNIYNSDEKRQNLRINTRIPLQYRKIKGEGIDEGGSLTKDLGEGGVRFAVEEFIPFASRFVITINLPTSTRPIKAIAKIAWIKKLPTGDQYEVGNQFIDMAKEDKQEIANYIKQLSL